MERAAPNTNEDAPAFGDDAPSDDAPRPPASPGMTREAANAAYIQASLDWLELRLQWLIEKKEGVSELLALPEPPSETPRKEASDETGRDAAEAGVAAEDSPPIATPTTATTVTTATTLQPQRAAKRSWWPWYVAPSQTPYVETEIETETEPEPTLTPPNPEPTRALPAPPPGKTLQERLDEAARRRQEAAHAAPPYAPVLVMIAERLGLSELERDTLVLCAAPELRTGFSALFARANAVIGVPNSPFPTFALALAALSDAPHWDIVSPERPLRFWRLIEIKASQPASPLLTSPLQGEERIVNALNGLEYLDDRLAPYLRSLPYQPAERLTDSQRETLDEILAGWNRAADIGFAGGVPHVVQLLGPDAPTKARLAAHAAAALRRNLYQMPLEQLPAPGTTLDEFARLFLRESLLVPVALYLDAHRGLDSGGAENPRPASLRRFLSLTESGAPIFLGIREAWEREGRGDVIVEAALPTAAEQRDAWLAALGPDAGDAPGSLSAQFHFDTPEIEAAVTHARHEAAQTQTPLMDVLWNVCRDSVRPRLDALAQRLEPRATLDDLVLPDEPMGLIQQIKAQVAQRGRVYTDWGFAERSDRGLGISVLFAGESGTGKTMAAEALANALKLSLYRIDLSSVVSKYIGETEENLRKVFDTAEEGGVILFFDEADALFGKRTEVRDSHDRYANIEVNYLLQRMESYQGLAILATNRKSALDAAFLRRLRFLVTFPFPGVPERKRLWEKAFPKGTPTEKLEFDRLARLALTGGNIAGVVLNAAFLAADAGTPVTMPLVLRAARTEFVKLNRPINEAEFRP